MDGRAPSEIRTKHRPHPSAANRPYFKSQALGTCLLERGGRPNVACDEKKYSRREDYFNHEATAKPLIERVSASSTAVS